MRVLLVGVGGFGTRWVGAIMDTKGAKFAGLVDTSAEALKAACETPGLGPDDCFTNLDLAIKTTRPDVLVCSTPPAFHKACLMSAAKAGVHFLTEKPMTDNMADACRMVETAEKAKITFAVSQNYRYFPGNAQLAKLVHSGKYGKPGTAAIRYFMAPVFNNFRREMPYVLTVDMSIHHYDLIRFILNDDPVAVIGRSWNPHWSLNQGDSCANVMFEMKSGLLVNYLGSWASTAATTKTYTGDWRIETDKATLLQEADRVFVAKPGQAEMDEVALPGAGQPVARHAYQAAMLRDFLKAVAKGQQPATSGRDNLKSLAMVFKSVESFKHNGRREKIEL